jgi:hypothetical protein
MCLASIGVHHGWHSVRTVGHRLYRYEPTLCRLLEMQTVNILGIKMTSKTREYLGEALMDDKKPKRKPEMK